MAVPTRLRIAWLDDNTLKVETDAGTQTRLFPPSARQRKPPRGSATWQGDSMAQWERPRPPEGPVEGRIPEGRHVAPAPGYLRKNGVPYSADAVLTEYWDVSADPNGDQWITITSTVQDDRFLREPWVTVLNFKRERDGAKWDPTPCSVPMRPERGVHRESVSGWEHSSWRGRRVPAMAQFDLTGKWASRSSQDAHGAWTGSGPGRLPGTAAQ